MVPDPMPENSAEHAIHNITPERMCMTAGLRVTAEKLVKTIRLPASAKHDREVIEFAIDKSHSTIARRIP
jgi:hypothetical protein